MSLELREVRFDLDHDDVRFLWNPEHPAFSLQMNAISFIAISFEKFIVAAVTEALPLIADPAVRTEAREFLDQEAQHAGWHREHVRALTRRHPGLAGALADTIASFDRVTATRSLPFRLAYIADLEATFTSWFKLLLDNDRALFAAGDDRVASLFLWHFVEEIEHRSSGLIVYGGVVPRRWYRTLVLPGVLRHVSELTEVIAAGFNRAVPAEDRGGLDARTLTPRTGLADGLRNVPGLRRRLAGTPAVPDFYAGCSAADRRAAVRGVLRSQNPFHDPADSPLPDFARRWFERYEAGEDVGHWYTGRPVPA